MPYFGRITLARVLAEVGQDDEVLSGSALLDTLDRLADPADSPSAGRSACRAALAERSYVQAIAWWAARLAEALEHAHDRGVLHRDIKPSNVLVIDDGMPMLLDFNLARESVLAEDEEGEAAEATLGGTVDYMAPEHLESLAEGLPDRVDRRSDIYGLGVLLYEAIVGKKPFLPPRKTHSVSDLLLRAADERRHDPGILFSGEVDVPAPLRAVIRRCLEPEPEDRYQGAAELAADLRAIADDLPLCHAREPIFSRVNRRLRRNRRRLAGVGIILLAGAATLGAYLSYQFERYERFDEVRGLYLAASTAIDHDEFPRAQFLLDNAAQRASHSELGTFRNLLKWETFWGFGGKLRRKLDQLWMNPGLEDLEDQIRFKASMSAKIVIARKQADNLLQQSENLHFRLIGLGDDLPGAINELKSLLGPFHVLTSKEDWTKLDYIWGLLDENQKKRLRREVNELLFLWMVQVETSFHKLNEAAAAGKASDPGTLRQALNVCDRVLTFAEPREPWLALRALLQVQRTGPPRDGIGPPAGDGAARSSKTLNGEPVHVGNEKTAPACFQWGLLCSSQGRPKRAIEWIQQAVWLDWSNYWYQFYLAYLLNQEGLADEALDHYSAAVACQPESSWVRFNRARIYRAKGRWSWALDDLLRARKLMGSRAESLQVALEIGALHWSLGNFVQAANEFRGIIAAAPSSVYACAARLNLANIDAESGREESARATYEALLKTHPDDRPARLSRANLSLRQGRPEDALTDLDVLLGPGVTIADRDDVLATRAIARLLSRQRSEAVADAALAQRLRPCPAHERLLQRTLLAAGRFDELQLHRPGEVLLLPAAGAWLTADLRAAATELSRRASGPESPSSPWAITGQPSRFRIAPWTRRPSLRRRTWFGPACCIAPATSSVPSTKSTLD
jgi:tetratricopeptide (TPR) repeat protein